MASFLFNSAKVAILQGSTNLGVTVPLSLKLVNYSVTPTAANTDALGTVALYTADTKGTPATGVTDITTGVYPEIDNPGTGEVIISFKTTTAAGDNDAATGVTSSTWSSVTTTANGVLLYTGTQPIAFIDFGSAKSASNGNFVITWDTTGVIGWT